MEFCVIDNFSKIRPKLRDAENKSDTDLTSATELQENIGASTRSKRNSKFSKGNFDSSSDEEDDCNSLLKKSSIALPAVPKDLISPPLQMSFADYEKKCKTTNFLLLINDFNITFNFHYF